MDIKELRKKTQAELIKIIKQERENLRDMRFRVAAKQYKDVRDLRGVKHDVARILTVLKEKEILNKVKHGKGIKKV